MPTIEKEVSWLEKLKHEQILSIEPNGEGRWSIQEECDRHYDLTMTDTDVRQLAMELLHLVGGGPL